MIAVANAPCSWGVLEFESKSASPGYEQVLEEIAASGYAGTELGDWGFMPTEPAALQERLDRRRLAMVGAFVTTRLADPRSYEASVRTAVETARLLSAVGNGGRPVIVLSDEPTADPARAGAAGRVEPALSLTGRQWDEAAKGVERIAAGVRDETGLRTVFHHHCASYVETPDEIDALMAEDRSNARRPVSRLRPCDVRWRFTDRVAVATPSADVARPLQGLRAAYRRARPARALGLSGRAWSRALL